ncbi:hypothetical protein SISNIDRAFT_471578 [Sistotremastrum niveocremeum HHB9708]|uniref:Uncharacterized protein n=1 Tax=Sistotremastrum niveocremeum HHB9708 TaxID=1314777 RepID=A0A164MGV5_9AGAM|nr:hypothetical protein SISNIDRAFT_471578 [Sistotremastrum niveocremeum HHB9708]
MDERQHGPKISKLREIFGHGKGWSTTSGSGVRMVPKMTLYAPPTPTTEPLPHTPEAGIKLGDAPPPPPAPLNPPHIPPPQHIRPLRLWGYINYIPDVPCIPLGPLTPTEVDDEDLAERLANMPLLDGVLQPEIDEDGGQAMRLMEAERNANALGAEPVATPPPPPPVPVAAAAAASSRINWGTDAPSRCQK